MNTNFSTPNDAGAGRTISVMFVNQAGGGFAENIDIPAGTTVQEFFRSQMSNSDISRYAKRLRRGDQIFGTSARTSGA